MENPLFDENRYAIELLTPRQAVSDFDAALEVFEKRYRRILESGSIVSIPDNPLGNLHFTAQETISFLDLPMKTEDVILHLNSFHRKQDLDAMLADAAQHGLRHILCVSGDGGPRLPKLDPEDMGIDAMSATSVELLTYIRKEFPGAFSLGVAFNQYEPRDHETMKLERKLDAGAEFIITQPVMGHDENIDWLLQYGIPVRLGAWMSKNIELLYTCVGRDIDESARGYEADGNLKELHDLHPTTGFYLSLLGFKRDWNHLLIRQPPARIHAA